MKPTPHRKWTLSHNDTVPCRAEKQDRGSAGREVTTDGSVSRRERTDQKPKLASSLFTPPSRDHRDGISSSSSRQKWGRWPLCSLQGEVWLPVWFVRFEQVSAGRQNWVSAAVWRTLLASYPWLTVRSPAVISGHPVRHWKKMPSPRRLAKGDTILNHILQFSLKAAKHWHFRPL